MIIQIGDGRSLCRQQFESNRRLKPAWSSRVLEILITINNMSVLLKVLCFVLFAFNPQSSWHRAFCCRCENPMRQIAHKQNCLTCYNWQRSDHSARRFGCNGEILACVAGFLVNIAFYFWFQNYPVSVLLTMICRYCSIFRISYLPCVCTADCDLIIAFYFRFTWYMYCELWTAKSHYISVFGCIRCPSR